MKTEVCGKGRVKSYLAHRFKNLATSRIAYKCYGESKPVHTKDKIDKIPDEQEKEKAHKENRRTIIIIL